MKVRDYQPKKKCDKCPEMAQWHYMPSDGKRDYCDACVPRGCSCNDIDGEPERDEMGRECPCCEYSYYEEGIDE